VPRVGEMIDAGLEIEAERLTYRVTRVLHAIAPAPTIQLDVTSKML
jgi:hypothetical protein